MVELEKIQETPATSDDATLLAPTAEAVLETPAQPMVVDEVVTIDAPAVQTEAAPMPDLFGDLTAQTAEQPVNSGVVDSVMSTSETNEPKILGPKPKTSSGLEVRARQSFSLGGLLFKLSILVTVVTFGFFYTQLNPNFALLGQNPVQKLADFEASLQTEQTTVNLYNYMITKFALDDFSVSADAYLHKYAQYESDYTSSNTKAYLKQELGTLEASINEQLVVAQNHLREAIYPAELVGTETPTSLKNEYKALMKTRINEEKLVLLDLDEEEAAVDRDILNSVLALLNDSSFRSDLVAVDLSEPLDSDMIQLLFQRATEVSTNEFSTILNIKSARVNWGEVFGEIEEVTKEVDPLYGSGITSNIEYSNLSLNSSDQTISLRGSTRTDDTLNFSLISDLLDVFEQSTLFSDVSNRSFTKSEDRDDGFTASFTIEFQLQYGEDSRDSNTGDETLDDAEETLVSLETTEETTDVEDEIETDEASYDSAVEMLSIVETSDTATVIIDDEETVIAETSSDEEIDGDAAASLFDGSAEIADDGDSESDNQEASWFGSVNIFQIFDSIWDPFGQDEETTDTSIHVPRNL